MSPSNRQRRQTPEHTRKVMTAVRAKDTSPEIALRKALYALGVRGWRCHRADLPGTPDLAFGKARLAVFVDGGFWHGHPSRWPPGRPYWDKKIARNVERDRRVESELISKGWRVLRLWDFEVLAGAEAAAGRVIAALEGQS